MSSNRAFLFSKIKVRKESSTILLKNINLPLLNDLAYLIYLKFMCHLPRAH